MVTDIYIFGLKNQEEQKTYEELKSIIKLAVDTINELDTIEFIDSGNIRQLKDEFVWEKFKEKAVKPIKAIAIQALIAIVLKAVSS